jgi:hypothetical protein
MLEGIAGSVTGAYQQTLTAKAPQPNRVAARPQELEGEGAEAAKATGETAAENVAGTAARDKIAVPENTAANRARIFTSPDPIVGETATAIERALSGAVKDVNVPIENLSLRLKSEADIMLKSGDVIEVKSRGGKGATAQMINQAKIIGDSGEVIAFGPKLKPFVVKELQGAGFKVFKNLNDLVAYIKSKGL